MKARASTIVCTFILVCTGSSLAQNRPKQPTIEEAEPKAPTKPYAQTYEQSFKAGGRPEGWNYTNRMAEHLVQFEPAGVRITVPTEGPEKGHAAGIVSGFGIKGDFEITLSFSVLKDPDPADVGKAGTRLSLSAALDTPALDTPKAEIASLSRSMSSKGFVVWMRNRDNAAPLSYSFSLPTTFGELGLVRSGDELSTSRRRARISR